MGDRKEQDDDSTDLRIKQGNDARLAGSLVLLGLSIISLVIDEVKKSGPQDQDDASITGKWGRKHPKPRYGAHFSKREWLEAAVCLTFVSH